MTSQHILRSQLPRQSLRIVELCTNGRVAEAKALVDGGLDLDSLRGLDKLTLFTHCCVWGDFSLVLQLLDLGATLDFRGTNGATPLMQACRSGRLGVVHNLIKLGAQLDASNLGEVKTWVDLAPRSLRCGLLLCLELEVSIPRLVRMATGRFGRFFSCGAEQGIHIRDQECPADRACTKPDDLAEANAACAHCVAPIAAL